MQHIPSKPNKIFLIIYFSGNVDRVVTYCFEKLGAPPAQWRRIIKTLTVIEFILKNGSPSAIMSFKREVYKISSLMNFSFIENGNDRGAAVRDKA